MQKIIKEMIWYMDENPNKNGTYLYAQFSLDGVLLNIATVGYTKKYGWNSSKYGGAYSWDNIQRRMEVMHGRNCRSKSKSPYRNMG